eukprot:3108249-Rhodomonas_salina.1
MFPDFTSASIKLPDQKSTRFFQSVQLRAICCNYPGHRNFEAAPLPTPPPKEKSSRGYALPYKQPDAESIFGLSGRAAACAELDSHGVDLTLVRRSF